MPYRRLPNTDAARIKALETAIRLGESHSPRDLAFSSSLLYQINSFLPKYNLNLKSYQLKKERLSNESKILQQYFKRAKMYLSHFIQVMLFSIQRGELPEETKRYMGINNMDTLPPMNAYTELIEWSERILDGEKIRTQKGLQPITNPTAGVVRVHFDHFLDQYRKWSVLQKARDRDQEKVQNDRTTANQLVSDLWDEVEKKYADLPGEQKREKAAEYGIQYVYRSNELRHIGSAI
jgi:hypothetical protein